MSQAILSVLASDVIQTTTITGYYNIHALFHYLFYPSFLYNHTNPSVNFINRSVAIRLFLQRQPLHHIQYILCRLQKLFLRLERLSHTECTGE